MLVGEEFAAVDQALSRHRDDSELTALNRLAGRDAVRPLGRRLYTAIAASDRARRSTDGRFDARILADLERLGDHGADLGDLDDPPPADRPRSGPQTTSGQGSRLRRDPRRRSVSLDRPHDLGGIGKGLALRWAADRVAGAPRLVDRLPARSGRGHRRARVACRPVALVDRHRGPGT